MAVPAATKGPAGSYCRICIKTKLRPSGRGISIGVLFTDCFDMLDCMYKELELFNSVKNTSTLVVYNPDPICSTCAYVKTDTKQTWRVVQAIVQPNPGKTTVCAVPKPGHYEDVEKELHLVAIQRENNKKGTKPVLHLKQAPARSPSSRSSSSLSSDSSEDTDTSYLSSDSSEDTDTSYLSSDSSEDTHTSSLSSDSSEDTHTSSLSSDSSEHTDTPTSSSRTASTPAGTPVAAAIAAEKAKGPVPVLAKAPPAKARKPQQAPAPADAPAAAAGQKKARGKKKQAAAIAAEKAKAPVPVLAKAPPAKANKPQQATAIAAKEAKALVPVLAKAPPEEAKKPQQAPVATASVAKQPEDVLTPVLARTTEEPSQVSAPIKGSADPYMSKMSEVARRLNFADESFQIGAADTLLYVNFENETIGTTMESPTQLKAQVIAKARDIQKPLTDSEINGSNVQDLGTILFDLIQYIGGIPRHKILSDTIATAQLAMERADLKIISITIPRERETKQNSLVFGFNGNQYKTDIPDGETNILTVAVPTRAITIDDDKVSEQYEKAVNAAGQAYKVAQISLKINQRIVNDMLEQSWVKVTEHYDTQQANVKTMKKLKDLAYGLRFMTHANMTATELRLETRANIDSIPVLPGSPGSPKIKRPDLSVPSSTPAPGTSTPSPVASTSVTSAPRPAVSTPDTPFSYQQNFSPSNWSTRGKESFLDSIKIYIAEMSAILIFMQELISQNRDENFKQSFEAVQATSHKITKAFSRYYLEQPNTLFKLGLEYRRLTARETKITIEIIRKGLQVVYNTSAVNEITIEMIRKTITKLVRSTAINDTISIVKAGELRREQWWNALRLVAGLYTGAPISETLIEQLNDALTNYLTPGKKTESKNKIQAILTQFGQDTRPTKDIELDVFNTLSEQIEEYFFKAHTPGAAMEKTEADTGATATVVKEPQTPGAAMEKVEADAGATATVVKEAQTPEPADVAKSAQTSPQALQIPAQMLSIDEAALNFIRSKELESDISKQIQITNTIYRIFNTPDKITIEMIRKTIQKLVSLTAINDAISRVKAGELRKDQWWDALRLVAGLSARAPISETLKEKLNEALTNYSIKGQKTKSLEKIKGYIFAFALQWFAGNAQCIGYVGSTFKDKCKQLLSSDKLSEDVIQVLSEPNVWELFRAMYTVLKEPSEPLTTMSKQYFYTQYLPQALNDIWFIGLDQKTLNESLGLPQNIGMVLRQIINQNLQLQLNATLDVADFNDLKYFIATQGFEQAKQKIQDASPNTPSKSPTFKQ